MDGITVLQGIQLLAERALKAGLPYEVHEETKRVHASVVEVLTKPQETAKAEAPNEQPAGDQ